MEYKIIAPEAWSRRELFDFFSGVSHPFYSTTFRLDVTKLYDYSKSHSLSFYYALTYLVTKAVNSVEALRYAKLGDDIVLLDRRKPSFTDLHPGSENFHIVTMPADGSIEDFCREAKRRSLAQTRFIDPDSEGADLIFISCLPWVDLTGATNERDFDRNDAVPRITWGRYTESGGRKTLGMAVELNHRFADGVHIGMLHRALCELMDAELDN